VIIPPNQILDKIEVADIMVFYECLMTAKNTARKLGVRINYMLLLPMAVHIIYVMSIVLLFINRPHQ